MLVLIVAAAAVAFAGSAYLNARFRHAYREPALSCLAPNRSRGPNRLCQKPTPRGGYCSTHHDQRRRDDGAVWGGRCDRRPRYRSRGLVFAPAVAFAGRLLDFAAGRSGSFRPVERRADELQRNHFVHQLSELADVSDLAGPRFQAVLDFGHVQNL